VPQREDPSKYRGILKKGGKERGGKGNFRLSVGGHKRHAVVAKKTTNVAASYVGVEGIEEGVTAPRTTLHQGRATSLTKNKKRGA